MRARYRIRQSTKMDIDPRNDGLLNANSNHSHSHQSWDHSQNTESEMGGNQRKDSRHWIKCSNIKLSKVSTQKQHRNSSNLVGETKQYIEKRCILQILTTKSKKVKESQPI